MANAVQDYVQGPREQHAINNIQKVQVDIPAMRHMLQTQPEKLHDVCDMVRKLLKEDVWAKLVVMDNKVGLQLLGLAGNLAVALAPDARDDITSSPAWRKMQKGNRELLLPNSGKAMLAKFCSSLSIVTRQMKRASPDPEALPAACQDALQRLLLLPELDPTIVQALVSVVLAAHLGQGEEAGKELLLAALARVTSLKSANIASKALNRLAWKPLNLTFMEYATLVDVILAFRAQPVAAKMAMKVAEEVDYLERALVKAGPGAASAIPPLSGDPVTALLSWQAQSQGIAAAMFLRWMCVEADCLLGLMEQAGRDSSILQLMQMVSDAGAAAGQNSVQQKQQYGMVTELVRHMMPGMHTLAGRRVAQAVLRMMLMLPACVRTEWNTQERKLLRKTLGEEFDLTWEALRRGQRDLLLPTLKWEGHLAVPPLGAVMENSFDGAERQAKLAALQADSAPPATVVSSDGQAVLNAVSPEASKQLEFMAACKEHNRESQELAKKLQNKLQWMQYLEVSLQAPKTSMTSALLADLLGIMAECFVVAEVEKSNLVEDGYKLALEVVQSCEAKFATAIRLLLRELP